MVSKTAKIIAFFLLICLITPSGVLAQENEWLIPVFNNVSDVREEPNLDIEFNGITIIIVGRSVFMPENRIEPLDFKKEFEDVGRDENITFKEYDEIDNDTFFNPFLERHPFMRFELKPIEVENWTVNNITLTGKIRVHVTIFKNGFCSISLVFPIVTDELKDEYNLKGDFLIADKPLQPDDVVSITAFSGMGNISLKEGETTINEMLIRRRDYLQHAFFDDKTLKRLWGSKEHLIYSWNISKRSGKGNSTELVKKNPWVIYGILTNQPIGDRTLKFNIFSAVSEVFTSYDSFQIIGNGLGYFNHEPMANLTLIDEYGYNPETIRLAEVVFLQEYMLGSYNTFVTEKFEEQREKEESDYPEEIKEIVQFRKEISIALDEFYLIEDSLHYSIYCDFVRYGKQKRNLDFMHEILRIRLEELSKISVDMNNVIMQENNAAMQKSILDIEEDMENLTVVGIVLAVILSFVNILFVYRERKSKQKYESYGKKVKK
jgi:hypothetical protein